MFLANRAFSAITILRATLGAAMIAALLLPGMASSTPYHTIDVDGFLLEWEWDEIFVDDPVGDVRWPGNSDSDDLYVTWDSTNIYIGFTDDGAGSNSAMIFVDTDLDDGTGWTDFQTAPTWKRRITFTGMGIDLYFGEYGNHTGREIHRYDSGVDTDISAQCEMAYAGGGHEMSIPWDEFYPGGFPVGATIRICAGNPGSCDVCGAYDAAPNSTHDSDEDGTPDESDPDVLYDTVTDLDQFAVVFIDEDGDGIPDDKTSGVPGIDANGNPYEWEYSHVKAIDPRGDDCDPVYWTRDLIAFYFTEVEDRLVVRTDILSIWDGGGDEQYLDVYFCLDFVPGGTTALPAGIVGTSPVEWDRCLKVDDGDVANARLWVDASTLAPQDNIKAVSFSAEHDMVEGAIWKSFLGELTYPIRFYVFTVEDGSTSICDDLETDTESSAGTAKVAYMHHGNQSLTATTVLRGWDGPNSGFDEILRAHDAYDLKGNFHLSGTLQSVAEWFDPDFNDWLQEGAEAGRYCLVTSAYAQHIMPFVNDDMNDWALWAELDLIDHMYDGFVAKIGWVPERVWVTPWGISGGVNDDITPDWREAGIEAIILDDSPHGDLIPPGTQRHKIWQMNGDNAPLVFLRDGNFTGNMHSGTEIHDNIVPYFVDFANASDQEQVIVFADDWEVTAEEGGFHEMFPYALEMYRDTMKYIGGHPWVQCTRMDEMLDWGWSIGNFDVTEGTYGLLGGTGGYGGSDNIWYRDWAPYVPWANGGAGAPAYESGETGNMEGYENIWMYTHANLVDGHTGGSNPQADSLTDAGWYVMMAQLYETGWHDGPFIAGWEHKHSSHVKNANVLADAADWVVTPPAIAEALLEDVDYDGYTELVMRNAHLMAVFDRIGGCLRWLYDSHGQVVSGNDMAYWNNASLEHPPGSGSWHDDAGDFSDGKDPYSNGNQTAVLTDSWMGGEDLEKSEYSITILEAGGLQARVALTHGEVTKEVTLRRDDQYLDVTYTSVPDTINYMISGFSPNVMDLLKNGQANLQRLYQGTYPFPEYAGQLNTVTGTVGAIILGGPYGGGLEHNWDGFEALVRVDQYLVSLGDRLFVYAGPGETAVLDSLTSLLDCTGIDDPVGGFADADDGMNLEQNRPNPFSPATTIRYSVSGSAAESPVRLEIFDVSGRLVKVLVDGKVDPGAHQVVWDGLDSVGRRVGPGVYFSRLTSDGSTRVSKMVLLK